MAICLPNDSIIFPASNTASKNDWVNLSRNDLEKISSTMVEFKESFLVFIRKASKKTNWIATCGKFYLRLFAKSGS